MKNLENVSKLFMDKESTKIISTVAEDGEVHSIVAGSIIVVDDDTMAVAEVFMNTTSANLRANSKVALLAIKGMESYLVSATVQNRFTDGELFDKFSKMFESMKFKPKAVWTFSVDKIYDEGAGANSGKQLF